MNQLNIFDTDSIEKKSLFKLFIDGASRGNPGSASVGCVIKRNDVTLQEHGYYIGIKTNNQAEYFALLVGLHFALPQINAQDDLIIISDSELMVKQLNGQYRVKDPILQKLYIRAKEMLRSVNHRVTHVLRAHNSHADMMANKALDEKIKLPQDVAHLLETYV